MDKILHIAESELRESTTIQDSIISSSSDWRNKWISNVDIKEIEDLLPIHFAVQRSVETSGETDWLPAFERIAGFDARSSINPCDLALQVYQECLFVKALNNLGD